MTCASMNSAATSSRRADASRTKALRHAFTGLKRISFVFFNLVKKMTSEKINGLELNWFKTISRNLKNNIDMTRSKESEYGKIRNFALGIESKICSSRCCAPHEFSLHHVVSLYILERANSQDLKSLRSGAECTLLCTPHILF